MPSGDRRLAVACRSPVPRPRRGRHPHRQDLRHGPVPSHGFAFNAAWLTAAALLAWLRLLALDGTLARAEPKTPRYRILHAAARLTRGARRRQLKIAAAWPWATDIVTAWIRISALAHTP